MIAAVFVVALILAASPADAQGSAEEGPRASDIFQRLESAKAHLWLGEYGAALTDAREAHRLLEMDPMTKRTPLAISVLSTSGQIYLILANPRAALKAFEEGDALAPAIVQGASVDPRSLLVARLNFSEFYAKMAVAEMELGKLGDADRAIDKGLSYARPIDAVAFFGLDRLKAQLVLQQSGGSEEGQHRALAIMNESEGSRRRMAFET